jgi:TadE-like protein
MLMRRLLQKVLRLRRNDLGVAALEFAIILPTMLLLVYGGYEGWRVIMAAQRADRVSHALADLASRMPDGATESDVTTMLEGGLFIAKPYDMLKEGRVVISAVDTDASRTIVWQRCLGQASFKSSLGAEGGSATLENIQRAPLGNDLIIYVVEARIKHDVPVLSYVMGPALLTRSAVVPGRKSTPPVINPGGPASPC